jgi:aspartate/glutamate racemase
MLGVLGGMSPRTTADVLSNLVKHADPTAQEHLPLAWSGRRAAPADALPLTG